MGEGRVLAVGADSLSVARVNFATRALGGHYLE